MALARILVDGYSLLHAWTELAPGKPRFSAAAREELIHVLTQYHDMTGTPLTVVFDGSRSIREPGETTSSSRDVEVLYSRAGQTADQIIERTAHRLKSFGEVLVVTDDHPERETVAAAGASVSNCMNFRRQIDEALGEMRRDLQRYNQQEQNKFNRQS
jgi:predicted RNA-binding protein with PIN domain